MPVLSLPLPLIPTAFLDQRPAQNAGPTNVAY
jgi:hypothetical protein